MEKTDAKKIIKSTFGNKFDEKNFQSFIANLLKQYKPWNKTREGGHVREGFRPYVLEYKIVGFYEDAEKNKIDILQVWLKKGTSLDHARTAQRNFVADYLKNSSPRGRCQAALVAFIPPNEEDWRFSLVKMDYSLEVKEGKVKASEEITPAKRWSFLVGKNEGNHTAQSRFVSLLADDENPTLSELEEAFNIEKVTNEFFKKYCDLFYRLKENLDEILKKDAKVKNDFAEKELDTVDFAKKTLGQIAFLYFLQKKGWFGVDPKKDWGTGPKNFIREIFKRKEKYGKNFFNDILEPLFYEALAQDRGKEAIYPRLNNCRMPFLNGGLFEPMNGYAWETTNILIPDELFSNEIKTPEGDTGNGILDVFDRYNFTVNEDEPLEKEVAVDPEMLGKVFENLLEIRDRKSKGAFYTPREIVHYMCQESLINYLQTETNEEIPREDLEQFIREGEQIIENDKIALEKQASKHTKYHTLLPESIRARAEKLDQSLANIKVCDPAVGSGAFPLGMINEIVRARQVLDIPLKKTRTPYELKLHAIKNSIHGVDIDSGAVEIAKLRLWLALVVEEKIPHPLPNLEHKIMQGNSLIEEYEGVRLFDEELLQDHAKQIVVQQALALNFEKNESDYKMKLLKEKIKDFISEAHRSRKQELKEEIDNLKWDLIEATMREQGKEDKLEEVKKQRKKNIRPFFIWKLEFNDVFREKIIEKDWQAYHLTWVTHNSRVSERMVEFGVKTGEPLLLSVEDECEIVGYLKGIIREDNLRVLALNICRDHVHLVLVCEAEARSNIVRKLKGKSAQLYKDKHGITEEFHLWAQKYHAVHIEDDEQLANTMEYVRLNREKHDLPPLSLSTVNKGSLDSINKGLQPLVDADVDDKSSPLPSSSAETDDVIMNVEEAFAPEVVKGGFDVVIGNPPYVFGGSKKISKEDKNIFKKIYFSGSKKINLFSIFIEKGNLLLKQQGNLCYIVPNTLLRVTSYSNIREFMYKQSKINQIVDLDIGIFDKVTASTIIIFLSRSESNNTSQLNIKRGLEGSKIFMPQKYFDNKGFIFDIFSNSEDRNIIVKTLEDSIRLGDIAHRIRFGVVISKNIEMVVKTEKINKNWKPFLEGDEINSYLIKYRKRFLNYEKRLLHRSRTPDIFENQKIMIQRITGGNKPIKCTYDKNGFYNKESIINLILKNNCGYDYKYTLALLNSILVNWFYKVKFTNESKLTVNLSKEYLSEIPIKKISPEGQKPFINLVDRILAITSAPDYNPKNPPVKQKELEKKIDEMVFDLYGLSEDERKVVLNS